LSTAAETLANARDEHVPDNRYTRYAAERSGESGEVNEVELYVLGASNNMDAVATWTQKLRDFVGHSAVLATCPSGEASQASAL
jgi:hypothetical protein